MDDGTSSQFDDDLSLDNDVAIDVEVVQGCMMEIEINNMRPRLGEICISKWLDSDCLLKTNHLFLDSEGMGLMR